MPIRVTVYGENLHEQKEDDKVLTHYPNGMHTAISEARFAAGKGAAK